MAEQIFNNTGIFKHNKGEIQMNRLEEIDIQIKENTKIIEATVDMVNRSIEKEFSLIRENKALTAEKKEIVLRMHDLQ